MGKAPIPDKKRDMVITMTEKGMSIKDICYALGISDNAVTMIKRINKMVVEDRFEEAIAYCKKYTCMDVYRWALERNGKMPTVREEKKKEEKKENVVVEEKPAEVTVKKIDEDQIARVMLALGKILDELEALNVSVGKCAEAWK
jgi:DNA-directed RNA polymerase specialized sigma subunit